MKFECEQYIKNKAETFFWQNEFMQDVVDYADKNPRELTVRVAELHKAVEIFRDRASEYAVVGDLEGAPLINVARYMEMMGRDVFELPISPKYVRASLTSERGMESIITNMEIQETMATYNRHLKNTGIHPTLQGSPPKIMSAMLIGGYARVETVTHNDPAITEQYELALKEILLTEMGNSHLTRDLRSVMEEEKDRFAPEVQQLLEI